MFGYITINPSLLEKDRLNVYKSYYCGLCHTLKEHYGQRGRMTLSNDMTFLSLLLSSLYEEEEQTEEKSCILHPLKKADVTFSPFAKYAADMNILLSYYKCLDHQKDDKSFKDAAQARMLKKSFHRVALLYPKKAEIVSNCLEKISVLEDNNSTNVDALSNLTGIMLGEVFAYKKDVWENTLRQIGEGLGRFVYVMDAYDDYEKDKVLRRFNPLTELHARPKEAYDAFMKDCLTLLIADATEAFEMLPLEKNVDILRNVLYSGVWVQYARLNHVQSKKKGADVQ